MIILFNPHMQIKGRGNHLGKSDDLPKQSKTKSFARIDYLTALCKSKIYTPG
jgi:hypothetical protein